MGGPITFEFVAVVAGVVAFVAGVWWRVEGRIERSAAAATTAAQAAGAQSTLALAQLAEFKIHAAETYVTKAGLREMKDEMLEAIRDVKGSVDHLNARLDTALINRQGAARRQGG